jgi:hypothetical protein
MTAQNTTIQRHRDTETSTHRQDSKQSTQHSSNDRHILISECESVRESVSTGTYMYSHTHTYS